MANNYNTVNPQNITDVRVKNINLNSVIALSFSSEVGLTLDIMSTRHAGVGGSAIGSFASGTTATCNNVGVPSDLMAVLTSGTVTETGVTPTRISTFTTAPDTFGTLEMIARSRGGGGTGDMYFLLREGRVTEMSVNMTIGAINMVNLTIMFGTYKDRAGNPTVFELTQQELAAEPAFPNYRIP